MSVDSLTLSLYELLRRAFATFAGDLHIGLPGKVVAFEPDTQRCDVQPLLKRTYAREDGTTEDASLPPITRVPIVYPRGGGWRITWPLAVGDRVWLVFGERSLDGFLASGLEAAPRDARRFDLSDAVAYPGIAPFSDPIPAIGTTDLILGREDGSCEIRLTAEGGILLSAGGEATEPLIRGNALNEYLTTRLSVLTPLGPSGPSVVPLVPGLELSLLAKVQ